MNIYMKGLLVFCLTLVVDYAYTRYNITSTTNQAHAAAKWSVIIYACAGFNVVAYTANHWMLIPSCIGAYLGTWAAVKYGVK